MRRFHDESGNAWVASSREEATPRHHGRWVLVFHPADGPDRDDTLEMTEVRWQTRATAERTLLTMSEFELRKRLATVRARQAGVRD
ncbi:MAG: hypothetical protein L0271_17820 [Gemmatimonadetes bacterium]|nr:hypothetical protein [Gemmatimonadota bacterium]